MWLWCVVLPDFAATFVLLYRFRVALAPSLLILTALPFVNELAFRRLLLWSWQLGHRGSGDHPADG